MFRLGAFVLIGYKYTVFNLSSYSLEKMEWIIDRNKVTVYRYMFYNNFYKVSFYVWKNILLIELIDALFFSLYIF